MVFGNGLQTRGLAANHSKYPPAKPGALHGHVLTGTKQSSRLRHLHRNSPFAETLVQDQSRRSIASATGATTRACSSTPST
jgi:hypothetical protein